MKGNKAAGFLVSKWIFDSSILNEKGKRARRIIFIVTIPYLVFFAFTFDKVFW